jgi:hypothetical protein
LESLRLAHALSSLVFRDPKGHLGSFWDTFTRLDSHIPIRIHPENSSFPFDALYQPSQKVAAAFRGQSNDCLYNAFDHLSACGKLIDQASPQCQDAEWLIQESRLALDMTYAGLKRAESMLKNSSSILELMDVESILERFPKVWLYRNRAGGLEDTMQRLLHRS